MLPGGFPREAVSEARASARPTGETVADRNQHNRSSPVFLNQVCSPVRPSLTVGLLTHSKGLLLAYVLLAKLVQDSQERRGRM
ncbi:MAG: hypothetical protein QOH71_2514 [Blastocatellia bacterium]|jgi:hypothetical protein|nr:hypothetical protein [Blastocatellia bacterium]